jgi:hypothetical protein
MYVCVTENSCEKKLQQRVWVLGCERHTRETTITLFVRFVCKRNDVRGFAAMSFTQQQQEQQLSLRP